MPIKLNGATSGSVELDVPAAVGSDLQVTLPATAGEIVVKDSSGNVGIGGIPTGDAAHRTLSVFGASGTGAGFIRFQDTSGNTDGAVFADDGNMFINADYDNTAPNSSIRFRVDGSAEKMRIDSSGRLLVGTSGSFNGGRLCIGSGQGSNTPSGEHVKLAPSVNRIEFLDSSSNASDTGSISLWNTVYNNRSANIALFHEAGNTGAIKFETHNGSSLTERMRITSAGTINVGSSTSTFNVVANFNNAAKLHLSGGGSGSANIELNGSSHLSSPKTIVFNTNTFERMRINASGQIFSTGVYNYTSANAANVHVFSDGLLVRSTSSIKYKTEVETIQDSYSDALLACRPVWYRSTSSTDKSNWGYWGFIAEEVAEIDPRLVNWKTTEVSYDDKGSMVETPCEPEPEGVQYDRFVPHLLNLIKRQQQAIETLETKVAALEATS